MRLQMRQELTHIKTETQSHLTHAISPEIASPLPHHPPHHNPHTEQNNNRLQHEVGSHHLLNSHKDDDANT